MAVISILALLMCGVFAEPSLRAREGNVTVKSTDCCRNCGGLCDPTSGQCTFEREYNDQLDCRVYLPRGYKYCPLPVDDGKIDSSPRVSSAKDCEDACRNTRGCLQFQFYNSTRADCDDIPAYQLLSKDCYYQYIASSCWEAYSRD